MDYDIVGSTFGDSYLRKRPHQMSSPDSASINVVVVISDWEPSTLPKIMKNDVPQV